MDNLLRSLSQRLESLGNPYAKLSLMSDQEIDSDNSLCCGSWEETAKTEGVNS